MATTFPTYPGTTFEQAVELAIFSSNQLHNIINGDSLSTVDAEDGAIPTVRKALIDNIYFKVPAIEWQEGAEVTVFNQLYTFSGGTTGTALWYAPTAATTNVITMGNSPEDDDNWRLYGWDTYSKTELSSKDGASYIVTTDGNTVQKKLDEAFSFAGKYESGTLTITSLYSIIEYSGSLWYVATTSTPPFTTTGTTSTTWAIDKANFVAVGDYTIRQGLIADDGEKLIGKCPDVATLRTIEPTLDDQIIKVTRYSSDCPLVNKELYYDQNDTTTADDGYSVFVTTNGARWKTDVSRGIDLNFTGLKTDGSNFGSAINAIAVNEVNRAVVGESIYAANTLINIAPKQGPVKGNYTLDADIVLPSFMTLHFEDYCEIDDTTATSGYAISFNNSTFYTNNGLKGSLVTSYVNTQGAKGISIAGGKPTLLGSSSDGTTSTRSGLFVGNTLGNSDASDVLNVRDLNMDGMVIRGYYIGLDTSSKNTYLCRFHDFIIENNYYNVSNSIVDAGNGGENMLMDSATIGNAVSANIAPNAVGQGWEYRSCSIDYSAGSVVLFRSGGRRVNLKFTGNTWIEGFGRYLVEDLGAGAWAATLYNQVSFLSGYVLGMGATGSSTNSGRRPVFFSENAFIFILIDATDFKFSGAISSANASLTTLGSRNRVKIQWVNATGLHNKILPDYNSTLNFGGYLFSGTEGSSIKAGKDAGTGYTFNTINDGTGFTMLYGGASEVTVDDVAIQPIKITTTTTTQSWLLNNANLFIDVDSLADTIRANVTLNNNGITSGSLAVALRLDVYLLSDLSTPIAAYVGDPTYLANYFSASGTNLGASDHVGIEVNATLPSSAVAGYNGKVMVKPSLRFTGSVGTYNVLLPAFYKERN